MKWMALLVLLTAVFGAYFLVSNLTPQEKITGGSPSDTASVTVRFNQPTDSVEEPPTQSPGGGGSSNSQVTQIRSSAQAVQTSIQVKQPVENYVQFAQINPNDEQIMNSYVLKPGNYQSYSKTNNDWILIVLIFLLVAIMSYYLFKNEHK